MTDEVNTKFDKVIDEMVVALKPVVAKIESDPAMTKGRYDRYLQAFQGKPIKMAKVMFLALVKAGANKEGVTAAFKITFGQQPTD